MRFINIILLLASFSTLIACSDDNDDASYYVKYEVSLIGKNSPRIEYNVMTDKGVETFYSTDHSFEKIYGPVKAGFVANINFDCSELKGYGGAYGSATIEVSKNNEPFSIKAAEQYQRQINLTYKIE